MKVVSLIGVKCIMEPLVLGRPQVELTFAPRRPHTEGHPQSDDEEIVVAMCEDFQRRWLRYLHEVMWDFPSVYMRYSICTHLFARRKPEKFVIGRRSADYSSIMSA